VWRFTGEPLARTAIGRVIGRALPLEP
jgi:hypothetical protein